MKITISGGDLGGQGVDFPKGVPGEAVDLESGGRMLRYELREYEIDGRATLLAVFTGYVLTK